jgi:hypothetical protein
MSAGLLLNGGVSTGKTTTDNCDTVGKIDNPSLYNCHLETPYLPQYKLGVSYPLPFGIFASGTVQSFQGPAIVANATFTNAQIQPSLGRPLSSGTTATVNLLPGSGGAGSVVGAKYYGERLTQVDVRFSRITNIGPARLKAMVDIYNLMNIDTVTIVNNVYGTTGSSWQLPTGISLARLFKLGVQFDF